MTDQFHLPAGAPVVRQFCSSEPAVVLLDCIEALIRAPACLAAAGGTGREFEAVLAGTRVLPRRSALLPQDTIQSLGIQNATSVRVRWL
jgi:hypothetical protein